MVRPQVSLVQLPTVLCLLRGIGKLKGRARLLEATKNVCVGGETAFREAIFKMLTVKYEKYHRYLKLIHRKLAVWE